MSTSFDDKFRYIRSQVDQKSAIPGLTSLASCTPAIKRTGSRLITRFPKSRKIENEITRPKPFGFLAPSHEPYKPYGLPASGEFDVFDWLSYSLHVKPPRNQTSYMVRVLISRLFNKFFSAKATKNIDKLHQKLK